MGRASYRTLRPQSADGRHAVAPLPDAALSWRGPDPTRCIARHPHLNTWTWYQTAETWDPKMIS